MWGAFQKGTRVTQRRYIEVVFYYPGSKGQLAPTYPKPDYPIVVEPFAGSMAYSLHHRPDVAIGVESDPRVVGLWNRLRAMSSEEIKAYPSLVSGDTTDDLWEILAFRGLGNLRTPRRTINDDMTVRFERSRRRALRHHEYGREHVVILEGDYSTAPDIECTWFIDPPYADVVGKRKIYKHAPDFEELAKWVRSRRGQVIVAEGGDASWLDFEHHMVQQTVVRNDRTELTWTANTSLTCHHCGTRFNGQSNARYCSTRCRVAAHRQSSRSTNSR